MGTRVAPRYGLMADHITDMLLFALPLGILGARAYYVIFYLSLYRNVDGSINWGEVIAIWDGGLAIYGAIIVCSIVVVVYSLVQQISVGALLDIGGLGLLIGQSIGRWGNFFNQEAYGGQTTLPWRMGLMVDGSYIYVHPTFLYESLWNALGLALLWQVAKRWRKYDGQIFTLYVAWYGLGRFLIEGLRSDSLYFFNLTIFGAPVRTSQLLALTSLFIACALLVYNLKCKKHTPDQLYVNRVALQRAEAAPEEDSIGSTAAPTPSTTEETTPPPTDTAPTEEDTPHGEHS